MAQRAPLAPSQEAVAAQAAAADFAAQVLDAVTGMAVRSRRCEADLAAALRGAGLSTETVAVRAALRLLLTRGCVANLRPLSDGGLLLTVTGQGLTQPISPWLSLDDDAAEAGGEARPS